MTREQIQNYLHEHPEKKSRNHIPEIVSELTGVSIEQVTEVKTAIRRLQEEIPNDEKGKKLEQGWREERGMETIFELAEKTVKIGNQLFRVK